MDWIVGYEWSSFQVTCPPNQGGWTEWTSISQWPQSLPVLAGQISAANLERTGCLVRTWPGSPNNSDKSQRRSLGFCIQFKFLLCEDKRETWGWTLPETHWSAYSLATTTKSLTSHSFLLEQGPWTSTSPTEASPPPQAIVPKSLEFAHFPVI